jgi:O-acetyl-ADP-ribose deacetylase (regulator of RNase III)
MLHAVQGDLTAMEVDAVVNAANEHLAHGGGVAAALSRAGGPRVQRESDAWIDEHGPLRAGQAAVTTAGEMPAAHIVHVVGPRYRSGQDNAGLLRQAVRAALDVAADTNVRSVALPAISAGIFGYPPAEAANVIARACADWLEEHPGTLRTVLLVGYDAQSAQLFATAVDDSSAPGG